MRIPQITPHHLHPRHLKKVPRSFEPEEEARLARLGGREDAQALGLGLRLGGVEQAARVLGVSAGGSALALSGCSTDRVQKLVPYLVQSEAFPPERLLPARQ